MRRSALRTFTSLTLTGVLLSSVTTAQASGFQIWEQNAGGIGDYHAGSLAGADAVADEFFNPAIATRIHQQAVSVGTAYIPLRAKFSGLVGYTLPLTSATSGYQTSLTKTFVPNFHMVLPLEHKWALAFGVTTPFGLATNYPDIAPVNRAATKTKLKTVNVNPSIAYQWTPDFSMSAGLDAMYGAATYNNSPLPPLETYFYNKLKGWGFGYNLGVLWGVSPETRVGIAYRSRTTLDAKGTSDTNLQHKDLHAKFPLPATMSLGMFHRLGPHWSVMASVFRTFWSVFKELKLYNTANGDIIVHENYRNTWNLALGAHYRVNDHWLLKLGFGYDQTPTRYGYRDVRLPDVNRFVMSVGTRYTPTKNLTIDLGMLHLFLPKTKVDNTSSKAGQFELMPFAQGHVRGRINVFGVQIEQRF